MRLRMESVFLLVLEESGTSFGRMPIDEKEITRPQLLGTEQPRKRADEISLDGALQVARSVSLIGALFEQKLSATVRHAEPEGTRRRI